MVIPGRLMGTHLRQVECRFSVWFSILRVLYRRSVMRKKWLLEIGTEVHSGASGNAANAAKAMSGLAISEMARVTVECVESLEGRDGARSRSRYSTDLPWRANEQTCTEGPRESQTVFATISYKLVTTSLRKMPSV